MRAEYFEGVVGGGLCSAYRDPARLSIIKRTHTYGSE
jgi:hypothetical protein